MSPPVWNLRAVILFHFTVSSLALLLSPVPMGSLSRGGDDVVVYVLDINQSSFPTPFYSVVVSISVFMAL